MENGIVRFGSNARMSKIVRANGIVFLCGQTAGGTGIEGIAGQTREALSRIDRLLVEAGSSRSHILSATIYLRDMDDFAAMNAEWEGWIPEDGKPARATVEARLASPHLLIELSITALHAG